MTVTFGGVELIDPAPYDLSPLIICNTALLVSGKIAVRSSPETGMQVQFECCTQDYSDITDLQALIGQKKTLILDDIPYTNCSIRSWDKLIQDPVNVWWYTVTIVRETII
jgi:hypothetical protein